ncbi:hypothetical protein SERAS_05800 [Serratia marcescens]|nr:hypothetical protein SERAS_05800 [Serratia marcescens]
MRKIAMVAVIAMITVGSGSVHASVSRQCEADNYIGKNGSISSPYQGALRLRDSLPSGYMVVLMNKVFTVLHGGYHPVSCCVSNNKIR